jgi:hypothetical protein
MYDVPRISTDGDSWGVAPGPKRLGFVFVYVGGGANDAAADGLRLEADCGTYPWVPEIEGLCCVGADAAFCCGAPANVAAEEPYPGGGDEAMCVAGPGENATWALSRRAAASRPPVPSSGGGGVFSRCLIASGAGGEAGL